MDPLTRDQITDIAVQLWTDRCLRPVREVTGSWRVCDEHGTTHMLTSGGRVICHPSCMELEDRQVRSEASECYGCSQRPHLTVESTPNESEFVRLKTFHFRCAWCGHSEIGWESKAAAQHSLNTHNRTCPVRPRQ